MKKGAYITHAGKAFNLIVNAVQRDQVFQNFNLRQRKGAVFEVERDIKSSNSADLNKHIVGLLQLRGALFNRNFLFQVLNFRITSVKVLETSGRDGTSVIFSRPTPILALILARCQNNNDNNKRESII